MTDESTTPTPGYIELPKESRMSYVLNGVGNGVMLGGAPFVIYELLRGEKLSHLGRTAGFATVAGAILGAVYGFHEADRIHEYRAAVSREISKLRTEMDAHKQSHREQLLAKSAQTQAEPVPAR